MPANKNINHSLMDVICTNWIFSYNYKLSKSQENILLYLSILNKPTFSKKLIMNNVSLNKSSSYKIPYRIPVTYSHELNPIKKMFSKLK